MSRYRREAHVCLRQRNFYIELGVGGAEILADVDNNGQRHDLSGSQRQ